MFKLDKKDFSIASSIFTGSLLSPVVFSVIEKNTNGRVFVNSAENPAAALIILEDMLFLRGEGKNFCADVLELLVGEIFPESKYDFFDFYCLSENLRPDAETIFESRIVGRNVRKTFDFNVEMFKKTEEWRKKIPDGAGIIIDEKNLSVELKYENETASRCCAVFTGGGQTETDVCTEEKYRRRGFASLTAAAYVETVLSFGYLPNWSCWENNPASAALAKKIGFIEASETLVYSLKK